MVNSDNFIFAGIYDIQLLIEDRAGGNDPNNYPGAYVIEYQDVDTIPRKYNYVL